MLDVSSEKISEEKEKGISGNLAVIPLTHLVDFLIFRPELKLSHFIYF